MPDLKANLTIKENHNFVNFKCNEESSQSMSEKLTFMQIFFNGDHLIGSNSLGGMINYPCLLSYEDYLPCNHRKGRVSQNIAISRHIIPARPGIVLTPPPQRPQSDNHRVLLQLTIVNSLDNS